MPRWLKITLLVAGLGGLAVFGSCSACAYWFKGATEDLKVEMEAAAEEAKQAYLAGQQLGTGLDDANLCFDHGEEAFAACGADPSAVMENGKCVNNAKMGIRGCVDKAPRSAQLCENVPRSLNFQMLMDEQAKRCPQGSEPACAMRFQARVEICEILARMAEQQAKEQAKPAP